MFKNLTLAAFAAVSMSAMAQSTTMSKQMTKTNDMGQTTTTTWTKTTDYGSMPGEDAAWRQKYDTYGISSVDVNSMSSMDRARVLKHELWNASPGDAFQINDFLLKAPADQELVLCRALIENFKLASAVRDEAAQSRFGSYMAYDWMSYPPLVWNSTPGSNSWASIPNLGYNGNMAGTMTPPMSNDNNLSDQITMTEDESRPMRMMMHNHGRGDIDYDRAIEILGSGLDNTDRGVLHTIFHPNYDQTTQYNSEGVYTNAATLDACIRVIHNNASMIDGLTRYSWYRHFDPSFYQTGNWSW